MKENHSINIFIQTRIEKEKKKDSPKPRKDIIKQTITLEIKLGVLINFLLDMHN